MSDNSKILIGPLKSGFLIKVIGRGTMQFCSDLFDFAIAQIEESENKMGNIYYDFSDTVYMDSSFIGLMVSIDKKLQAASGARIIVLNPSQKVKEILDTMGLLEMLPVQENAELKNVPLTDEINKKMQKDADDIKLLLKSHQNLMELNVENRKRFGLVEEMLKKELKRTEERDENS